MKARPQPEWRDQRGRRRPGPGVQQRIQAKIEDVREKIRSLQQIETLLEELAASCGAGNGTGECPVLDVLERPDDEEKR